MSDTPIRVLDPGRVVQETRAWLERAVIGLNLCPFAKSVHVKGQIHYAVSEAGDENGLLADLRTELLALAQADPQDRDTTLLMASRCLTDFLAFNDFLGRADALLRKLGFEGDLQIASFHPDYRFADADADDVSNFTNRSPWPTLHLLREASIDRAVAAFADAEQIFGRNMLTLRELGHEGWSRVMRGDPLGADLSREEPER